MKRLAISLFAAAALIAGCGSDDSTFVPPNNFQPNTPQGTSLKQIEQLARPGINEALLFSNAFLNTYNAVSPQFVAAALTPNTPENLNPTVQALLAEATTVLSLIMDAPQVAGFNGVLTTPTAAVQAFLPDVMRCDSSQNVGAAQTAYAPPFINSKVSPIAGRKLTDDVIDVTYIVLLDATGVLNDHVNYVPNAGNPATGHQPLISTFPYLAPAN